MKILFLGTPQFAVPSLQSVIAFVDRYRLSHGAALVGVVTQPDKPRGRGQRTSTCPVADCARTHDIPVYQPPSLKDTAVLDTWRKLDLDLMVVVAYGRILPKNLLDLPKLGTINVHASLLPKYRGAAPIQRALMAGERETGITTMAVIPELDAGPMLLQQSLTIDPNDTAETLSKRLADLGAALLYSTLELYREGNPQPIPQESSKATYAPSLRKEEGLLDWSQPAATLLNQIRGVSPWPGAWTELHKKRIKVIEAELSTLKSPQAKPGDIIHLSPHAIEVACGDGSLALRTLQLEGKRALPVRDFVNGFPMKRGDSFSAS